MMLIFLASISSFVCLFKCQIDCVCVCVCARLQFFRFVRFSPVRTYQREFDYYYCVCMNDNCLSANICIRLSPLPISFALSHTLAVRVRVCLFVVPYHQIGAFFFIGFHSWNEVQCAKIFQRPVLKCKFLSQNYYLINSAPFITRNKRKHFDEMIDFHYIFQLENQQSVQTLNYFSCFFCSNFSDIESIGHWRSAKWIELKWTGP